MLSNLGYACINTELRKSDVYSSRAVMLKNAKLPYIRQLVRQNLEDTLSIMRWNLEHNILVFRISSQLFPHLTNKRWRGAFYSLDEFKPQIVAIGAFARQHNMRISFHCSPYTVLGSENPIVVQNTINDLTYIYGQFIKMAKINMNVVIHFGCSYSAAAAARWAANFAKLPLHVKRCLVDWK